MKEIGEQEVNDVKYKDMCDQTHYDLMCYCKKGHTGKHYDTSHHMAFGKVTEPGVGCMGHNCDKAHCSCCQECGQRAVDQRDFHGNPLESEMCEGCKRV